MNLHFYRNLNRYAEICKIVKGSKIEFLTLEKYVCFIIQDVYCCKDVSTSFGKWLDMIIKSEIRNGTFASYFQLF